MYSCSADVGVDSEVVVEMSVDYLKTYRLFKLATYYAACSVRENVWELKKNVKSHVFWILKKKR